MTLMPVSKACTRTSCSMNWGAGRWMGRLEVARTGPFSSTGSPMTLRMRPRVALPTGTWMGAPVFFTATPRASPSVVSMAMQRTVFSPRCCATSTVRLSGSGLMVALVILRAVYTSGSPPGGNSTSTTGPSTCVILPVV
jgi:hypothetical protein